MSQTDAEPSHPAELIPRLAALIHSEGLSNGERARLKRTGLQGPAPTAYHRFVVRNIPKAFQGPLYDLAWRMLLSAIALQHHNPHDPKVPLGRGLARAEFSERRLETLLAAEGRVLFTLVTRAARRLDSTRTRCNWQDLAWLVFPATEQTRDRVSERIARTFYQAESTEHTTSTV